MAGSSLPRSASTGPLRRCSSQQVSLSRWDELRDCEIPSVSGRRPRPPAAIPLLATPHGRWKREISTALSDLLPRPSGPAVVELVGERRFAHQGQGCHVLSPLQEPMVLLPPLTPPSPPPGPRARRSHLGGRRTRATGGWQS